jgi:hypothetical protein
MKMVKIKPKFSTSVPYSKVKKFIYPFIYNSKNASIPSSNNILENKPFINHLCIFQNNHLLDKAKYTC